MCAYGMIFYMELEFGDLMEYESYLLTRMERSVIV